MLIFGAEEQLSRFAVDLSPSCHNGDLVSVMTVSAFVLPKQTTLQWSLLLTRLCQSCTTLKDVPWYGLVFHVLAGAHGSA